MEPGLIADSKAIADLILISTVVLSLISLFSVSSSFVFALFQNPISVVCLSTMKQDIEIACFTHNSQMSRSSLLFSVPDIHMTPKVRATLSYFGPLVRCSFSSMWQ